MNKTIHLMNIVVFSILLAGGIWYFYFTDYPIEKMPIVSVQGTLKSVTGDWPVLDFSIQESPVLFRVQTTTKYQEIFDRAAFFAYVRPGTKLTIQVAQADWENPGARMFGPNEIVTVHGLSDEQRAYCTIQQRRSRQEDGRHAGVVMFVIFCGAAIGYSFKQYKAGTGEPSRRG